MNTGASHLTFNYERDILGVIATKVGCPELNFLAIQVLSATVNGRSAFIFHSAIFGKLLFRNAFLRTRTAQPACASPASQAASPIAA